MPKAKTQISKSLLFRDLLLVIFSIALAVLIMKTGVLKDFLVVSKERVVLGSFFAGIFFTSVFTVVPATVVLVEMHETDSVLIVSLFGGFGALVGDLVIFNFVKDRLSQDLQYLLSLAHVQRLRHFFRLKLFRWIIPLFGALIVASPLPDELGLALMGLSRLKPSLFMLISFLLNSTGILVIGLITKAVLKV